MASIVASIVQSINSNLICTFIVLILHQLTGPKAQININNLNNCGSIDIAKVIPKNM